MQPAQIRCSKTWVPIALERDASARLVVTLTVPRHLGASACQHALHDFIVANQMELQISMPAVG